MVPIQEYPSKAKLALFVPVMDVLVMLTGLVLVLLK
jgi:hypothetical protein